MKEKEIPDIPLWKEKMIDELMKKTDIDDRNIAYKKLVQTHFNLEKAITISLSNYQKAHKYNKEKTEKKKEDKNAKIIKNGKEEKKVNISEFTGDLRSKYKNYIFPDFEESDYDTAVKKATIQNKLLLILVDNLKIKHIEFYLNSVSSSACIPVIVF